ncbi:phosphotransferase family protein [Phytoactinopolyspora halotolerans]|uniref:Aminoglycoside phosphotransferase family protein n=1 Tax=Phytoactinopolyspora halotolerans TaxID=1981512 RepID=A0A6L9S0T4_9ACTN|nr:aminoglycoside phosphotransferase family protein [Phytoactinopolyspora halotolerans]NED99094.1 aminoglycoside phosphotransferase family protein [Phytoactinopolyspora halotolerans]
MKTDGRAAEPRAVGVRRDFADIPDRVKAWAEIALGGAVAEAAGQRGGMSPGCAARLTTVGGRRAFVKAVGSELNPDTPNLFRKEIALLSRLPSVPYRPEPIATYDDGDWVALMLEDVKGRHPDLSDRADADAVWATVLEQVDELTPAPDGLTLPTMAETAQRWLARWADVVEQPGHFLPDSAVSRVDELHERTRSLPRRLHVSPAPGEEQGTTSRQPATLCHCDLRDDNLLIRPDNTVAILDWGMARLGPAWADPFFLALSWADSPEFDVRMADVGADEDAVTDLLLLFAVAQGWRAQQPAPPGLPTLPEFCRSEAERMFAGVARRL